MARQNWRRQKRTFAPKAKPSPERRPLCREHRPFGAILREQNDEWAVFPGYMSLEILAQIGDPPTGLLCIAAQ